jgi:hypothetical protein
MLGAGTFINPILRVITVVVILGAVYLFIVKPTLDTTNDAFDTFGDISANLQDQIDNAFGTSDNEQRLRHCLKQAEADGDLTSGEVSECASRF